jgi:hypothetical protein
MAKLYEVNEHPKEATKRDKARSWRRKNKNGRRFFTPLEMAIIYQDERNYNGMKKRGELKNEANGYISECGCGARGCCVHGSYKGKENPAGAELLKRIMNKSKQPIKRLVDERNKLAIKAAGFDTNTSFRL